MSQHEPLNSITLPAPLQALVRQVRVQQWQAYHCNWAYQYRATQLTRWRRYIDVLGLVISPSLIVAFVGLGVDAPRFFKALIGISALISTLSAALTVTSLIHKWDSQLALAITFPARARELASRIERSLLAIADPARDSAKTADRLQELLDESHALFAELEQNQMYVPGSLNLMAQQTTMMEHGAPCARCQQTWTPRHRPLTEADARRFVRNIKKNVTQCYACALPLPAEGDST